MASIYKNKVKTFRENNSKNSNFYKTEFCDFVSKKSYIYENSRNISPNSPSHTFFCGWGKLFIIKCLRNAVYLGK